MKMRVVTLPRDRAWCFVELHWRDRSVARWQCDQRQVGAEVQAQAPARELEAGRCLDAEAAVVLQRRRAGAGAQVGPVRRTLVVCQLFSAQVCPVHQCKAQERRSRCSHATLHLLRVWIGTT